MNNSKFITFVLSRVNAEPEKAIKEILEHEGCSHELRVRFALNCAERSLPFIAQTKYPKVYRAAVSCSKLLKRWLANPESVSKEELKKAANAAANDTYDASNAANAAVYAAYAAANAAYAAANAAYAAANAAHAAAYAAFNAANAAKVYSVQANAEFYRASLLELIKLALASAGIENKKRINILYFN